MEAAVSSEMSVIFNILLVSTPQDIAVFMVTAVAASDIAYCKHCEKIRFRLEFCEKQILQLPPHSPPLKKLCFRIFTVASLRFSQNCEKSVRMKQFGSHWTDFNEIVYLKIFRKFAGKVQVSLKSDKNNGGYFP
jgi:hypothetical protein